MTLLGPQGSNFLFERFQNDINTKFDQNWMENVGVSPELKTPYSIRVPLITTGECIVASWTITSLKMSPHPPMVDNG